MAYMSEREFNTRMEEIRINNESEERKALLRAEKNKYKKERNRMSTSNKVLIVSVISILLFTIACLYIQYSTGTEVSSTLIALWFSFWTVEIVSLAGIKVFKVKNEGSSTK